MLKAKNTLGLVFFPAFDWAISDTHPEREERLLYTQDQIFEEGIEDVEGIKFFNPIIASEKMSLGCTLPSLISPVASHSHTLLLPVARYVPIRL